MAFNNYQCSNELAHPKRVGGKLEVDALTLPTAKVDAVTRRLDQLNVNAVNSSVVSSSFEICGSVDHLTLNCQVRSPFAQASSDQVNYVNNFNPRPTSDPYSNTYNPNLRNHPNFSYGSNPPPVLKWMLDNPPHFKDHPSPNKLHKSLT